LELKAIHDRHTEIENEATRDIRVIAVQKAISAIEREHSEAVRLQKVREGRPDSCIVIYEINVALGHELPASRDRRSSIIVWAATGSIPMEIHNPDLHLTPCKLLVSSLKMHYERCAWKQSRTSRLHKISSLFWYIQKNCRAMCGLQTGTDVISIATKKFRCTPEEPPSS
jgi:hypothetical protein